MDKTISFKNAHQTKKKHATILNNLLDMSQSDSSLFAKTDNQKFFDIFVKFGEQIQNQTLDEKDFVFKLIEVDKSNFIAELEKVENVEQVIEIYEQYHYELSKEKLKHLNKDLQNTLAKIISHTKSKMQKQITKWKILRNKAIDINTENNIWPLYLGYVFISVSTEKKSIFAPLFLKEVQLEIKNSVAKISTTGEMKINEKLLFLLKNESLDLEIDFDFNDLSVNEIVRKLYSRWHETFQMIDSIKGPIPNLDQEEIVNEQIIFHSGVSLGFYMPTGGYLRNRMIEILENNEMDNIFEVEFNKNIYEDRINEILLKKDSILYKIQETNLSQDKATISALNQNTIIWGPPGTGKSQTITNIIANILAFQRTAIVVSQKKAALVVLRERMKSLRIFCLFILNSRLLSKKEFYNPIVEYLDKLEHFQKGNSIEGIPLISKKQRDFFDKLVAFKEENHYAKTMHSLANVYRAKKDFTDKEIKTFFDLDFNLKYDLNEIPENIKRYFKKLLEINGIKKSFFQKIPKRIMDNGTKVFDHLKDFNGFINEIIYNFKDNKKEDFDKISPIASLEFHYPENSINNEKDLSKLILKDIFNKFNLMDESFKKEYIKFAMAARTAHMNPQKFIEKFHRVIKCIFPVIITTPETELGLWKKKEFDYAILDESSQIFIEKGLPILYLAKTNILAGDNQQMQPTRWFSTRTNNDNDFGGIESLLDFAISKGGYSVLLDKNYRSNYASLMTFSSKHFYESKLDVLNVNKPTLEVPIEVYNVDGKWDNSVNTIEGVKAIELVEENLDQYKKIIILCFNSSQQNLIEKAIFEYKPNLVKAIDEQRLLLRNIENIQGNEADLIIISVSYDSNTKLYTTYVAKNGGKNALNVAISRAKDKMIVVKSINYDDIDLVKASPDMKVFREWLRFIDLSEEERKGYINVEEIGKTQTQTLDLIPNDELLEKVYSLLKNRLETETNTYALKKYSIGTRTIDIAILENNTNTFKLGLTIDNFNYTKSYIDLLENIDRELFIKTKQYLLMRITEDKWILDNQNILNEIIASVK